MLKRILFALTLTALVTFGQETPKWNPQAEPLWDPCHALSWDQRETLTKMLPDSPIKMYIVVLMDLGPKCVGLEWAREFENTPVDERRAAIVNKLIAAEYKLGEKANSEMKSVLLMVTAIRGKPNRRMTISADESIDKKIDAEVFGNAYLAFANIISKQGDSGLAHGDKIVEGLKAALPMIFQMLK